MKSPIPGMDPYLESRWSCARQADWRARIQPVPIPLRKSDPDAVLQLQPLIDRVYRAGGHDDIDYSSPLDPPLSVEDFNWMEQLVRQNG